jgi:hypothetical protein
MGLTRTEALILGSVLGAFLFLCLLSIAFYFLRKVLRARLGLEYDRVEHTLDEEEMEFKKIIEMKSSDIEELFDIADSEVDFDVKERDRLAMLETYRKNLVSGANSSSQPGSSEESDLRL